ncbi:MAG: zinc ribbon domain-containing protein YjdM [Candidatus Gracilibacteria bacterium]|jgi:protein PhnA
MTHYICKGGCGGVSDEIGVCEADGCSKQWEVLEECNCTDGKHGMVEEKSSEKLVVKDSNGTVLSDGDSVALIKDLTLRGSSTTFKRGTKANNIKLTDNPEEVDCRLGGMSIVLRTEFLKKL